MKKLLLLIILIGASLWAAWQYYARPRALDFIMTTATERLKQYDVEASFEGIALTPEALRLTRATFTRREPPITVELEEIECKPRYTELLHKVISVDCAAKLYDGPLSVELGFDPEREQITVAGRFQDSQMADHPQVAGFGVTSCKLSGDLPEMEMKIGEPPRSGSLHLEVKEFKSAPVTVDLSRWGVPLTEKFPATKDGHGTIDIELWPTEINIRKVDLQSTLGTLLADLAVGYSADKSDSIQLGRLDGNLEVVFSQDSMQVLAKWLPLMSRGKLNKNVRNFEVGIGGSAWAPRFAYSQRE